MTVNQSLREKLVAGWVRATNGWDGRDSDLWSAIRSLPSYGLVGGDSHNPMLSRKEVLALLDKAAEARYAQELKERGLR